jgi:DUF971 family protein
MSERPETINYHSRSCVLELVYEQDKSYELSCEYLRVYSPSAEVQGHSPDQAVLQTEKQRVKITSIEPQGNYAIKIVFDDGHDSGIYSWRYLYELATNQQAYWQNYLDRLEQSGAKRETNIIASSGVKQWQP